MISYRIEEYAHGVLVFGSLPVPMLSALAKAYPHLPEMDTGIASATGATLALVTKDGGKAWRAEIEAANAHRSTLDRWLHGCDTGTSSLTIAHVLGGVPMASDRHPSEPCDPADFGRCSRLLDLMPGWRERLGEVAERFPRWAGLVAAWPELEALYAEEYPRGVAPKLYARMQELRDRPRVGRVPRA